MADQSDFYGSEYFLVNLIAVLTEKGNPYVKVKIVGYVNPLIIPKSELVMGQKEAKVRWPVSIS